MIRAIFFDLDGTLIDSEKIAHEACQQVLSDFGIVLNLSDSKAVMGKKWDFAFGYYLEKYPIPLAREELQKRVFEEYEFRWKKQGGVIPGSCQAVRELSREYLLGVVSGSLRSEVRGALLRFEILNCFHFFIGAEDYDRSKPSPDSYLKALQLTGISPNEALVFEDSEPGIESALRAGIKVVAVSHANHFGHDLKKANQVIEDFSDVNLKWIHQFLKKHP